MTDLEYDVLDELYFVVPFSHLEQELNIEAGELKNVLQALLKKEWIKCFMNASEEVPPHEVDISNHYTDYLYLASKKGLLAHNGR